MEVGRKRVSVLRYGNADVSQKAMGKRNNRNYRVPDYNEKLVRYS
jgi:hypothetical protein